MPTLTELDVVLVMKGAEMVQKGLAGVKDQSAAADKGLDKVKDATEKAGKGMDSLTKITGAADRAFSSITGTLMGFVRAGLQGTVQGAVLEYRFQMLSREIATVFLPVINDVIDYLQKGINWFRSLSQEQVDSYRKWVLVGLGVLGVVAAIPKLVAAFNLLNAVMTANPVVAVTAAFALFAAGVIKTSLEIDALEKKLNNLKKHGTTEKEFGKTLAGARMEGVPLKPKTDEEREQHAKALADLKAHQKDLEDQAEKIRERAKNRSPLSKFGGGLVGMFNPGNDLSPQSTANRLIDIRKEHAAARQAITALETGNPVKFAPGAKPKDQLAIMPTHGFQSFDDKWRTGQLAALRAEDPNKQTAENTKEMKEKINAIALKLATMPFPIIR